MIAFSNDGKNIAAISNDGEPKISFWFWEKAKLFCHQTVPININGTISEIHFHPNENNLISVVGNGVFKTLKFHDGAFKATSTHRQENKSYLSHIWLSPKLILLGTKEGKFFVSDDMELHNDWILISDNDMLSPIRTILQYGDSFIVGNGLGAVNIFERLDEKGIYRKTKEILTNDQEIGVHSLTLSPSAENFVVTLDNNQVFGFSLASAELLKVCQVKRPN